MNNQLEPTLDTSLLAQTDQAATRHLDPIALIRMSGKAESTQTQYIRALQPYLDAGGHLADIDALAAYAQGLGTSRRRHLQSALALWSTTVQARIKSQVTPETVITAQAAIMRLQAMTDLIQTKPAKGQKRHIWLSAKQVRDLYNSCGADLVGQRDTVVLGLLVGAGLRRAELAALDWDGVYLKPVKERMRTVVHVLGKGTKTRDVPISDRLATILDGWNAKTGGTGRIARSLGREQRLGESLSETSIFRIARAHGAAIGVPELAAHDLRRTYAQLGYQAGVPISQISTLLGHASVKTTQRYLDLSLDLETTASDFVPFG